MQSERTLLITGAGKRLGRALALRAAAEGWSVALHCHRSQAEAEAVRAEILALGQRAEIFPCDLADVKATAALIPDVTARMGPLRALVNNASLFLKDSEDDPRHRAAHRRVNYEAPLQLTEAFAAQPADSLSPPITRAVSRFAENRLSFPAGEEVCSPSVLTILDGCFGWSMGPDFYSYTESRLALWRETERLALSFAPRLRINALAPGHTLKGEMDKTATEEKLRAQTPLKRLSNSDEFCDAAMFLLTAPSVTGQVLQLNGGLGLRRNSRTGEQEAES